MTPSDGKAWNSRSLRCRSVCFGSGHWPRRRAETGWIFLEQSVFERSIFSYALGGFEAGITPWRNFARDGSVDDLGAYVGYAIANANVNAIYGGLKAGTVTIDSYSLGTYWTHFSPAGWYLDTVLQGTWYGEVNGAAGFTGLSVSGGGLAASVTGRRPFS